MIGTRASRVSAKTCARLKSWSKTRRLTCTRASSTARGSPSCARRCSSQTTTRTTSARSSCSDARSKTETAARRTLRAEAALRGGVGMTAIRLRRALVEEIYAHARAVAPEECCGLLGGRGAEALSVYPLRNVARAPAISYEAAPEELFEAQRRMRVRVEMLTA